MAYGRLHRRAYTVGSPKISLPNPLQNDGFTVEISSTFLSAVFWNLPDRTERHGAWEQAGLKRGWNAVANSSHQGPLTLSNQALSVGTGLPRP
jgi:hypothetical protein